MIKFFLDKTLYDLFYLVFLINEKMGKKHKDRSTIAEKFIKYNNNRVLKILRKKSPRKISILLPHCIQNYNCPLKITSEVENCKECGKCKIGDILKIKKEFDIDVKVATGGTLARLYIKQERPDLIIAVACKRDLVSGIHDAFPFKVYGIFNEIKNMPCIDTDVSTKKIREVLKEVKGI